MGRSVENLIKNKQLLQKPFNIELNFNTRGLNWHIFFYRRLKYSDINPLL